MSETTLRILSTVMLFSAMNMMCTMVIFQSKLKQDDTAGIIGTFALFGGCALLLLLVREFCLKP